jgi:hypothetical protein
MFCLGHQLEDAIREYSKGLDVDGISPEEQHYLYSQRCESLAEYAWHI